MSLLVSISADLQDRANAGAVLKLMAPLLDGRGGGKEDLAQGVGSKPEGISAALEALRAALKEMTLHGIPKICQHKPV